MPSGPPPSAVAAIKKAREDFIAKAAAKGYDPTKGDPNIIAQGYTPVVDTASSSPLRGFVSSYDKPNASGYVVNYNADLSQINKATKDGWEYVYATDSATGKRYVAQVYNPEQGGAVYDSSGQKVGDLLDASGKSGDSVGQIVAVGAAFALPGVGAALAAELGVSAAVGTAIASVAVQTAQGVDLDTAIKNATVNAVVQTGSVDVAKEINTAINDPAVTNAITSVGASVVKTAALGGNADDIVKNATAALVGSGVSTATEDKVLGSAAAGAVTGGATGAALGAAGALGAEAAKPEAKPTGIQVAEADTGTVSDAGGAPFRVEASGTPIYKESPEASTYKPISGYRLLSTSEVDAKPEGSFYDPTTNAWLTPETTPPFEPAVIDGLSLIQATGGGGRSGFISPNAPAGIGATGAGITDRPGTGGAGVVGGTGSSGKTGGGTYRDAAGTEQPASDMGEVTITAEREPIISELKGTEAAKDKEPLYRPELFIYGGQYPSSGALSRALGTTLQAPGSTAGTTTGLTSYRAPGEIEGESGIERENVWNEASLRLKDALGL